MNYCTKCASYYQQPGTCNCYAPLRPYLAPLPLPVYPPTWVPYPLTTNPYPTPTWITYGIDGNSLTVTHHTVDYE